MGSTKTFNCVESMREIRDRISEEIADLEYEELVQWLRSHRYRDPLLQRLVQQVPDAAEPAAAADGGSRRR